jgi:hypothetical protein
MTNLGPKPELHVPEKVLVNLRIKRVFFGCFLEPKSNFCMTLCKLLCRENENLFEKQFCKLLLSNSLLDSLIDLSRFVIIFINVL